MPSMHPLVVLTAPRPAGMSYLEQTLDSLAAAGPWNGPKIILSDGDVGLTAPPPGWAHVLQPAQGQAKAMWSAFRLALAMDANYLTFFEDDVHLCRNALPYIEAREVPDGLAFVTWFDATRRMAPEPGLFHERLSASEGKHFQGACALTLPARTLQMAVKHSMVASWPLRTYGDGLLGKVLDGMDYGVHIPNLVQHVGAVSAAGNPGGLTQGRSSPTYPGDDHDALG